MERNYVKIVKIALNTQRSTK